SRIHFWHFTKPLYFTSPWSTPSPTASPPPTYTTANNNKRKLIKVSISTPQPLLHPVERELNGPLPPTPPASSARSFPEANPSIQAHSTDSKFLQPPFGFPISLPSMKNGTGEVMHDREYIEVLHCILSDVHLILYGLVEKMDLCLRKLEDHLGLKEKGNGMPIVSGGLKDLSLLLEESFEYIGHGDPALLRGDLFMGFKHEEDTGPGVEEWFLLHVEDLQSSKYLFVAYPNDRRRFLQTGMIAFWLYAQNANRNCVSPGILFATGW
ncbi:hypothetical protein HAX54_011747, partial [Datura stramonium]|nr:hypothetical protein [Datura stramonium]